MRSVGDGKTLVRGVKDYVKRYSKGNSVPPEHVLVFDEAQRAYYEQGRITLDRFLDACAHLERAELLAAAGEGERVAAREKHLDTLTQVLRREQADLQAGRGTQAAVAEAQHRREVAETLDTTERLLRLARKSGFAVRPSPDVPGLMLLEKVLQDDPQAARPAA